MSEATKQAVEQALIAHLNDEFDEEPWLITQWYAIVAASNQSMDITNYVHVASEGPLHVSLGLIRIADNRLVKLMEVGDE